MSGFLESSHRLTQAHTGSRFSGLVHTLLFLWDSIWKGKYSAWPAPDIGRHRVSFFAKVSKFVGAESGEKLRTGTKRGEKGRKRILKSDEKQRKVYLYWHSFPFPQSTMKWLTMLNVLYDFLIAPTRTSIIQYCFTRALRRWPCANSAMPQKEARTHSYKGKLQ